MNGRFRLNRPLSGWPQERDGQPVLENPAKHTPVTA